MVNYSQKCLLLPLWLNVFWAMFLPAFHRLKPSCILGKIAQIQSDWSGSICKKKKKKTNYISSTEKNNSHQLLLYVSDHHPSTPISRLLLHLTGLFPSIVILSHHHFIANKTCPQQDAVTTTLPHGDDVFRSIDLWNAAALPELPWANRTNVDNWFFWVLFRAI